MQFKIDENLPIEIAELLNDAGHDAITVNNQQLQGARDHLLINAFCQIVQYNPYHNTSPFNTGFSMAYKGINGYSFSPIHVTPPSKDHVA